ncbi:MAG: hypothetical protein FWE31_05345 [Firmicutes bacterium]|nr:hypothetical protein [Bacillota bacterium]
MSRFLLILSAVVFALTFILSMALVMVHPSMIANPQNVAGTWREHRMIAHALGGIDGYDYTNSLEVFKRSLDMGFVVFEVDLRLIAGDELVAMHSLGRYNRITGQSFRCLTDITLEHFLSTPIRGRFTPITWETVAEIMRDNPHIYMIIDGKYATRDLVIRQYEILVETAKQVDPEILLRIIPQVYNRSMLEWIQSVHEFQEVKFTRYQELFLMSPAVIRFVRDNPVITNVGIPDWRVFNSRFARRLQNLGVTLTAHTINSEAKIHRLVRRGVWSFYTDFLPPNLLY